MIKFVNAKINLGLQIVRRREDGYHDLQTLFYPIGLYAGTPSNPVEFCDILEVTPSAGEKGTFEFVSSSPYPAEQNLVYKAAKLYYESFPSAPAMRISLEKHIPDGAGIGGGSADASLTLRMLNEANGNVASGSEANGNEVNGKTATDAELAEMALMLGADCPFFLLNAPAYAEGVGEKLEPVPLNLSGYWLLLVRPFVRISTKEAFAGVTPRKSTFDLRGLPLFSINTWKFLVHNDFEDSIFPQYPELAAIKRQLYATGALYASLTGSGSCLYGIYPSAEAAASAADSLRTDSTIQSSYLLKL